MSCDDLRHALTHLVVLREVRRAQLRVAQRVDADLAHQQDRRAGRRRRRRAPAARSTAHRSATSRRAPSRSSSRDPLAHGLDARARDAAGELEEQLVLGLEVRVERAAREAGALADRLDGCRVQAHFGEHLGGGIQQLLTGGFAAARRRPLAGMTVSVIASSSRLGGESNTHALLRLRAAARSTIHSCIRYSAVSILSES